jgi:hypothetical protein
LRANILACRLGDLSESPFIDFTPDPPQPVGAYRVEIYANGNLDHVASFRGAFPPGGKLGTWQTLAPPARASVNLRLQLRKSPYGDWI